MVCAALVSLACASSPSATSSGVIYSEELPSTPVWYVLNLTAFASSLDGPTYEADGIHTWELSS